MSYWSLKTVFIDKTTRGMVCPPCKVHGELVHLAGQSGAFRERDSSVYVYEHVLYRFWHITPHWHMANAWLCLLCYYIVLAMSEKVSLDSKWPIYVAWSDFHEQFLSTLSLKCPTTVYSFCILHMSVVYLDKHIRGLHLFFGGDSRRLPELSDPTKWTLI